MKSILDPSFRYTPAAATDLRKTFARVRRERARQKPAEADVVVDLKPRITPKKASA